MERLKELISQLKEQFDRKAEPSQMLETAKLLEAELQLLSSQPAPAKVIPTKIAVMMPSASKIYAQPAAQQTPAPETRKEPAPELRRELPPEPRRELPPEPRKEPAPEPRREPTVSFDVTPVPQRNGNSVAGGAANLNGANSANNPAGASWRPQPARLKLPKRSSPSQKRRR